MLRKGEKLVFSTRWFDDDADRSDAPANLLTIEVVIVPQGTDERHEALSKRPNLFNFLKNEARTRIYA